MYRVKFILSDGRKIYPTDKGRIEITSQPFVDERGRRLIEQGGYTKSLGMFIMGRNHSDFASVRIVEIAFEHEASPFDRSAFVLGGQLASEAAWQGYHNMDNLEQELRDMKFAVLELPKS